MDKYSIQTEINFFCLCLIEFLVEERADAYFTSVVRLCQKYKFNRYTRRPIQTTWVKEENCQGYIDLLNINPRRIDRGTLHVYLNQTDALVHIFCSVHTDIVRIIFI